MEYIYIPFLVNVRLFPLLMYWLESLMLFTQRVRDQFPALAGFFFLFFGYLSPFYLYTQKEGQIASPFASPLLALFPARPKGPRPRQQA